MTPKRLILSILTVVVIWLVGGSLIKSWNEPQISSRLQLYQTDLLLHASEVQPQQTPSADLSTTNPLLGADPLGSALEEYQTVRQTAETSLKQFQNQLNQLVTVPVTPPTTVAAPASDTATRAEALRTVLRQQQDLITQLDVRIGILQAQKDQTETALQTWETVEQRLETDTPSSPADAQPLAQTAQVLQGLWSDPPRLLPDAEQQLQQHLDGWFRYTTLTKLYQFQQRSDALAALQATEQEIAQQTLLKLALLGTVPLLGCLAGVGLLIFLLVQRSTQGKQAILAQNESLKWDTPWDWEIVWQVLIVGFFFVGQIALPLVIGQLGQLGISFAAFGTRSKAVFSLTYYLLMAGSGLLVLFFSIKPYLPLPEGWFRFTGRKWTLWGIGGYLIALPLMLGVSWLNQQIWQGQGGSNPLLQLVLEEGDKVALGIFLFTAAIAAPIFEETLFRGFLLPSLTRYLPVWGAIAISSLLFAIAHLSLSEVLPLTVLGAILGFVYTRSRNLLAPMLLHSLWNSVTMIGLFILGSGTR